MGEVIAQVQDLCRVVTLLAYGTGPGGEIQRPIMAKLSGTLGGTLLLVARETLLEKGYPLAGRLQEARWAGPRLPHDILPRIQRKQGDAPEEGRNPEDLYTAAEVGGWMAREGASILEGLHTFRHNLSRYLSDDSSDLRTRVYAMGHMIPLAFLAREHGWQRTLEFLDGLWADAWLMDLTVALFLRTALVRCLAKSGPRPASAAAALDALNQELGRSYHLEAHELPALLGMLAAMQGQIDTGLKQLRHNSRSLTEWLRGLHALLLPTHNLAHMLNAAARQAEPALMPDLQRQYRFYEEIRADTVGCIVNSWRYVPQAIADEVRHQRTRRDAKRALRFYCHSRVFIPLALLPPLEEIIDSWPEWPPPEDSKVLHMRFAEKLRADLGGGFVQAYKVLHPKEKEDRLLAVDASWSQLKSSPEYQALPYLGQVAARQLYLTSGMRSDGGRLGDGRVWPAEVNMRPTEENSHHPTVTFPTDEQGHTRRAHILIRSGPSEPRPGYDTSGAAAALIGLLNGVHLAARNAFPADHFEHVVIAWPDLPIRLVLTLEQSKVATMETVEVPATPDPARAVPGSDPWEQDRVMRGFFEAITAATGKALFAPVLKIVVPSGLR